MCEVGGIFLFDDMVIFYIYYLVGCFVCYFNFVGDDNLGDVGFSQFVNDVDDLGSDFWVECCGRFIEQQNLWFYYQCVGDSYLLLLVVG